MDPLRWSSHLEDCLLELDKNQEWPGDELLVHMVKMQLVIEKATLHHWYGTVMEPTDHARTPPTFYVQALRAQLKEVWATFPPRSQEARELYSLASCPAFISFVSNSSPPPPFS